MFGSFASFADRAEAGRALAAALEPLGLQDPVIYALPRGGVMVASAVAAALGAPLDLVLVRKIGAPGAPELALGAVADGACPQSVINEEVRRMFGVDDAWIARARERAAAEIERRRALYMQRRAPIDARGRTAVIVDDGLATGATMRIAVRALNAQQPRRLVVAVPVAHPAAVEAVRGEGAEVVCLHTPDVFPGVGAFYADFHQLNDGEVIALLDRAAARPQCAAP